MKAIRKAEIYPHQVKLHPEDAVCIRSEVEVLEIVVSIRNRRTWEFQGESVHLPIHKKKFRITSGSMEEIVPGVFEQDSLQVNLRVVLLDQIYDLYVLPLTQAIPKDSLEHSQKSSPDDFGDWDTGLEWFHKRI